MAEQEFAHPAVELAPALVGAVLIHGATAGMIVETEAYLGVGDLAAHASRGITKRTQVLFEKPGRAYVYFIYGLYECLNIVADQDGVPGCVLIRALEPIAGIETMRERRGWTGKLCGLTNGPGKLTVALGINRTHYGVVLTQGDLTVRRWQTAPRFEVGVTRRIGIKECVDWPLRFVWKEHTCLSRRTMPEAGWSGPLPTL